MTYPKGWTGSLPLCPLIFSCLNWNVNSQAKIISQTKFNDAKHIQTDLISHTVNFTLLIFLQNFLQVLSRRRHRLREKFVH